MTRTDRFVVPEAPPSQAPASAIRRRATGGRFRLALLDNTKSNAEHLLQLLAAGAREAVPLAEIAPFRKPHPAAGARPELLDRIAAEADLVVSAMAD